MKIDLGHFVLSHALSVLSKTRLLGALLRNSSKDLGHFCEN